MFFSLTINSLVWILIGLSSMGWGIYLAYRMRMYTFAFGLISLGIGCICCGLTNGFTDTSTRTHLLRKFGKFTLIVGLPVSLYYIYLFMYNS